MRSPFSIGGHQPLRAVAVALGDEPPIEADGGRRSEDDHRRISIHWLAGTILTGLSGAGLIGAAACVVFALAFLFAPAATQRNKIFRRRYPVYFFLLAAVALVLLSMPGG